MATKKELEQGIQRLDSMIQAEQDPVKKQQMLDDLSVLAAEYRGFSGKRIEEKPEIEDLRAKKTDLVGLANALASGVNKGLFSLFDLPFDVVNAGLQAFGLPSGESPSEAANRLSERIVGLPLTESPYVDTPTERMFQTTAEYAGGGFGYGAAAKEVGQRYLAGKVPTGAPDTARESLARTVSAPDIVGLETAVATGAGALAAPARESGAGPVVEMGASFAGGLVPSVASTAGRFIGQQFGQFGRTGTELRVGKVFSEETQNMEQALENLSTNQLLVESTLPPGTQVDAARLSEDPGVMRVFRSAAENDSNIHNIIGRNQDQVSEAVLDGLEEAAAGDTATFLSTLNARTNDWIGRLESEIDLARNQADKIEQRVVPRRDGSPVTQDQLSIDFTAALDKSYKRAKDYEARMWSIVDKKVPMDAKRFRLTGLRLRNQMLREGYSDKSFAGMFGDDEIMRFGKKIKQEDGTFKKAPDARETFEALQRYRSRLLSAKREAVRSGDKETISALSRLDNLINDFIDSGPNVESYRAATEVTRTINQNYNRGKLGKYLNLDAQGDRRIDPEVALNTIVVPGANIGQVRRALEVEQQTLDGIPPAKGLRGPIEEALILKFPIADTPKAREKFFEKYGPTLRKFPHLSRDLDGINKEINVLAERRAGLEGRLATKTDEEVVGVSALLGADPDDVMKTLRTLTRQDLKNVNAVAVEEGVQQGLQTIYIREIVDKLVPTVASRDIPGTTASLSKVLKNNKYLATAFTDVLTPEQRKTLANLDKVSTLAARDLTRGGRSVSAAKLAESSGPVQIMARFFGVLTASKVGPSGPASLQFASTLARVSTRFFDSLPAAQSRAVLTKAATDPEYLKSILSLQSKGAIDKATEARQVKELETFFRRSGIRGGQELQRIYKEEQRKDQEENLSPKALSYLGG